MSKQSVTALREEVEMACAETVRSPGERMQRILGVLGLDFGSAESFDALFAAHYLALHEAHTAQSTLAPRSAEPTRHTLELKDLNGVPLKEGDIVIGLRGYVKSDGYLPKAAPDTVRVVFRIEWSAGYACYQLKQLGYHPDDQPHVDARQYRSHYHAFEAGSETYEKDGMRFSTGGRRKDLVCENVERYDGPISLLPTRPSR